MKTQLTMSSSLARVNGNLSMQWPDYFGLGRDETYLETRARYYTPTVLRDGQEAIAYFIPERRKIRGIPFRYLIPHVAYEASPFAGLPPFEAPRIHSVLQSLTDLPTWDCCVISRCGAHQEAGIAALLSEHSLKSRWRQQRIHAISGDHSFDRYFSGLGANTRKAARAGWRGCENEHIEYRQGIRFEQIRELYAARHQVKDGDDYAVTDRFLGFFRELREQLEAQGRLRETGMFQGDRLVAMAMAFESHGHLHAYQFAYDPGFSKLGLGRLALLGLIRDNLELGFRSIDLMNEDPHLSHLTNEYFEYRQLMIFSHTLRGRILSQRLARGN